MLKFEDLKSGSFFILAVMSDEKSAVPYYKDRRGIAVVCKQQGTEIILSSVVEKITGETEVRQLGAPVEADASEPAIPGLAASAA